jgi:hypothetical protein
MGVTRGALATGSLTLPRMNAHRLVIIAAALPHLVGSSIDLSAFTGTGAPVELSPDALALGLPAGAIFVLALTTLLAQTSALNRRGITGMLRAH